jgi:hypothetical protein
MCCVVAVFVAAAAAVAAAAVDLLCCAVCPVQYAEMEMRHRFVNHARNVWDRAVSLLPRIDQLWYK